MKKTKLFLLCLFSLFLFNLTIINATEANLENNDIVEKTTFTLTYNARGGKTTLTKVTVEENEIITVSSKTPAKTGYKFLGWDTQSTGKNVVYKKGDQITMTENITLYAVYGKKVKVTLDLNGGKSSKKYVYVYTNDTYSNLPKPTRTGYIFKGWYTSESNGTLVDSTIKVTKSKNHYIYALWTPKTYTITYNLNGGTNSSKNKETYTIKSSTFKLYSPTKTGYTFKGWYTSSSYKTKITEVKKGSYGNKNLYAKWQVNKYNIYFNGNGATSGSTKKQTGLLYTKSYNLRSNGYVRKGYTFLGWNTKKDGSGTNYTNKNIIKGLSSKNGANIYLYAQWKLNNYSITYNLNGGTLSKSNPENYTVLSKTITLNNPTKEGYTFKGWYTSSSYKTKITEIKKGSYGNKNLYAKWQVNKYNIYYNGNGATSGSTKKQTGLSYINQYQLSDNGYKRTGYKFVGWNTKKDGSGTNYTNKNIIKGLSSKNGTNIYLYAQWDIIEYTITYVNDGLYDNGYVNKKTYTVEDNFGFYYPSKRADGKPGYYFWGWYTDSSFKNSYTRIKKGTTGDIVLYAKWSVPKSPSELYIDHEETKEIILDKEDNDASNDSYKIQTTFGAGSDYYVSCYSKDTSIVKCSTDGKWDEKTLTYTLTPMSRPGTTTVEIYSYRCEYYYDKYGDIQRNCTYYKRIPITVTVPNHWDEINFIIPNTIIDEDGIELAVNESKIIAQSSFRYTLKLSTTLTKANSSSSSAFNDGDLYYYDKYGNLLGEDSIYISGLKYSTVGQTFEHTDEYVPLETKKVIYGREYDTTGDLAYEYTEGPHLWDNVNVLAPNKIVDKDSFGKQMQLINYGFFDEKPDELSSIYKISALLKMINNVDGDDKDFETTVYFYDKDGNELSNEKVTLENVKADKLYKIALDVPNNTKTIAFDKDYYLTGRDTTLNEPWNELEAQIQNIFPSKDAKSYYSYSIINQEYIYMNKDYYGIDLTYQITSIPTGSYNSTTFAYIKFYDANGEKTSCKYLEFEKGDLGEVIHKIIPIKKGIKKIVIDTNNENSSCYY